MTTPRVKPPKRLGRRVSLDASEAVEPSLAKQSFKAECDINNIMDKYKRAGVIGFQDNMKQGRFADLTNAGDYHLSLNKVLDAQRAFDALPSGVRSAFQNDPSLMLEFVADPANLDRAIELGIAKPREAAPAAAPGAPGGAPPAGGPQGSGAPKSP